MKKLNRMIVAIVVLAMQWSGGQAAAGAVKTLPAGGGYNAACLDYGVEMRNEKVVRSCLLAAAGDFPTDGGQQIPCAEKYSIAFRPDGKLDYCTLGKDTALRRTMQETVVGKAGGRAAFYPGGTVEAARLKDSAQLPYAKNSTVACRSDSPVTFRADGNVATCVLDQEILFTNGARKKTAGTCRAGGMIAFDDFGAFNGCYPPPPATGTASSGGTLKEVR